MGDQSSKALWTRPTLWKSALVIAPLAGAALFIATGTSAQTSGGATQPNPTTASTTVAPKPAPDAARRGGPKGGGRDKIDTGLTESPASNDTPVEARRKGPKGDSGSDAQGRTSSTPPTAEERRREGPKGDGGHGRTETPAPDTQPIGRRREGPKGAGESGRAEATSAPDIAPVEERQKGPKGDSASDHDSRTATPPAPDTQPTGRRRKGPKGDVDHGRTATTPLIIGALGAATVLALVVSSGNDRPASP